MSFTWRDMVRVPVSKLDDDAFTKRDPAEVLPNELPEPIRYESHRQFVKDVLNKETHLRAQGTQFVDREDPNSVSVRHRQQLNKFGAPSEIVAQGYRWAPGTELVEKKSAA